MRCPHCGFENTYARVVCADCKRDMTKKIDSRFDRAGAETAGELAADIDRPKLTLSRSDVKLAVFLSAAAIVLLLTSLSMTWYHIAVFGSSYDFGIIGVRIDGNLRGYDQDESLWDLMLVTQLGVAVSSALLLVLIASCLLNRRPVSVMISGVALLTTLVVELRFITSIQDAFRDSVPSFLYSGGFDSSGLGIGWYAVVLASTLQTVILWLLFLDFHRHQFREFKLS